MLFDATTLFFHTGSVYAFTAGEFVSVAGVTNSTSSTVVNLGNPRDLGIGEGAEVPQLALIVGTGITSSSASLTVNAQFQGSTDSTHWTTYAESGAQTTASFTAGSYVLPIAIPRRPSGVALPLYYQINLVVSGGGASLSTGSLIGGIVLARDDASGTFGQYPAGFSVS